MGLLSVKHWKSRGGRSTAGAHPARATHPPFAVIKYIHIFWTLVWTALFAFGCWAWSGFRAACQNRRSGRRCDVDRVGFAGYIFEAFVW